MKFLRSPIIVSAAALVLVGQGCFARPVTTDRQTPLEAAPVTSPVPNQPAPAATAAEEDASIEALEADMKREDEAEAAAFAAEKKREEDASAKERVQKTAEEASEAP
ncbi:MAG TPA: hypothetical protein VN397_03730 [Candidatus Methylomirabilis sp.]|nr:hypothetical protein [Candidatus Methylomirabilis sp.]